MLAEDIDFYQVFKIHPTSMVLLTADLKIVDANEEFLEETGRDLEDLVGHNIFEEFPKMPERPSGDRAWSAVEAAMTSGSASTICCSGRTLRIRITPASSSSTTGHRWRSPSGAAMGAWT
jgi:PAS domain-containing protein